MLCYNIEKHEFTSLHCVLQIKVNELFLVAIAVFFHSNCQKTNFEISSTQRFYSKEASESVSFFTDGCRRVQNRVI